MWALNNQTPFSAERCWVREKNGAEVWLVAVKGTFDIQRDGSLLIANEQRPVVLAPEFYGDPQSSSLLNDTDLPHRKTATDVLLQGSAYAPGGKPVKRIKVGFKVANIQKSLHVTGDRVWLATSNGVKMSEVKPFSVMPINYERAFGGMDLVSENPKDHDWDTKNPAGCGFAKKAEHLIGKSVPNIEDPKQCMSEWFQRPNPVGFGPIAGHWAQRLKYAGTYDEKWEKERQPLLPDDFKEQYHQCAPEDQQVPGSLKGGERVELFNLTPEGYLVFDLPRVSLALNTHFDDGSSEAHRAVINTVILYPNEKQVAVVWHTHLECHHKVLKLNQTSIRLKQRILLSEHDQKRMSGMILVKVN